jgi:hypothetical protein
MAPYATPGVLRQIPPDLTDEQAVEAIARAMGGHVGPAANRDAAARWNDARTHEERDAAAMDIVDAVPRSGLGLRVMVALSMQRNCPLLELMPLFLVALKRASGPRIDHDAAAGEPRRLA